MMANVTLFSFNDLTTPSVSNCQTAATDPCQSLNESTTCFGTVLPHKSTSFQLTTDASTLQQADEKLLLWSGLRAVPRCWDAIQPLLCSVYLPSCVDDKISLPDRSICEATRGPCKIVDIEYGWPRFLQCDNNDVYADGCSIQSLKFNKSDCEAPLIATNNVDSYYEDVEGCGLQCMNPFFNRAQHDDIHSFIAGWATVACLCTLFAMLSFFIDWKNSSKYPARIIFYINLCFFLGSIGWLGQFIDGAREEIVCRRDGTMRLAEPVGTGESASCVIIFVLVYFFLMAGITWFVILSYSWYLMFRELVSNKDPLKGKERRFHLIAWSVPFILMLCCLAVSQIDGDSMSGICFVGYKQHTYRLIFLLIPVGVVLLVGGFFICKGLGILLRIRNTPPSLLNENAHTKITWAMCRIGLFTLLALLFVFVTFAVHVYDYTHQATWEKSFREYIKCEANVTVLEQLSGSPPLKCHLHNKPSIYVMKLHLVALFGTGIVMSTWVWTKASAANWRRFWFKMIGRSDDETKRIRHRSRMIAKAFALRSILKRNNNKSDAAESKEDGADIEYSINTMTHQDPVGMDFDLHSMSHDVSSSWIRHVPKMVERRGAILPEEERCRIGSQHTVTWQPPAAASKAGVRKQQSQPEPGLWAVSQYIDGQNLKTKPEENTEKKNTAYYSHQRYQGAFIGTSPYYHYMTDPTSVPQHSHHHDNQAYMPNYACHGCQECDGGGNVNADRHYEAATTSNPTFPGEITDSAGAVAPMPCGILRNGKCYNSPAHSEPLRTANFSVSSSRKVARRPIT